MASPAATPASGAPPPGDPPPQLAKAQDLLRSGNPFGAMRTLQAMRREGEESPEIDALLEQARSVLQQSTDRLLSTGDSLYQDGKIKEALALWQAALAMDPFNRPAREKSQRALRILSNIETLQDQDQGAP